MQKNKRSKILDHLLDALVPDWGKLQTNVNAVFEQGRKEGFDDMEIGDFIRSKMKDHYSKSTIQRVLPKSAKHLEFTNEAVKMNASEREPIEVPADKVSISSPTEEHDFNTENMGVAIVDDAEDDSTQNEKVDKVMSEALGIKVVERTVAGIHKENSELRETCYKQELENVAQHNENKKLKQENATLKEGLAFTTKQNEELNEEVIKASNLIEKLQKENAQLREQLAK
jgi:hypothetical protein